MIPNLKRSSKNNLQKTIMSDEKKVSIYDPSIDAYREVTLSEAEEYVANLEEIKEAIAEAKEEE